jgi:hypothetical protein
MAVTAPQKYEPRAIPISPPTANSNPGAPHHDAERPTRRRSTSTSVAALRRHSGTLAQPTLLSLLRIERVFALRRFRRRTARLSHACVPVAVAVEIVLHEAIDRRESVAVGVVDPDERLPL